jgi:hypothetical protein
MEWSIPLQKLEVGKVQIGEIQHSDKSLVPLAYFDGQNSFLNLNIFLPKLKVQEFDAKSGKLVLSLKDMTWCEAKLNALQSTLLGAVYIQQRIWFPESFFSLETLNNSFKPIVQNGLLNLYYPVQLASEVRIYKDGVWHTKYTPGLINPNDSVRIMFRIQGISLHKNSYNNIWSGKFRLQHRIYAVLVGT